MKVLLIIFAVFFIAMVIAIVKFSVEIKRTRDAADNLTEEENKEYERMTEEE